MASSTLHHGALAMARIEDNEIEGLRAEVSLALLVESSGVTIEERGRDLVGCCPSHGDDSPSLVITPEKNLFN